MFPSICFDDFSIRLLRYVLCCIINQDKNHKFKDGDMVFYYDSRFSNIHRLNLRSNSIEKDLTSEVLYNSECFRRGEEWDLLTGVYFWLPNKERVLELQRKEKGVNNNTKLD